MFNTEFEREVHEGLTAFPKYLSSKYFYDEVGDKIFQEIMNMEEYYVTQAELNCFTSNVQTIIDAFTKTKSDFDLVELGAGDGLKTKVLLKGLLKANAKFSYLPIDISQHAIDSLEKNLENELPDLEVKGMQGEYFQVLSELSKLKSKRKIILFLGSNIGNLPHPRAIAFLKELKNTLNKDDLVFIGMDQTKNPATILKAYNDSKGITAKFNLNVLKRINKDLGGDFVIENFIHYPYYNPETGTAKSFLVSKKEQTVNIAKLNLTVDFDAWETIHTEISQKYTPKVVKWLMDQSELKVKNAFTDENQFFANYLLERAD